MNKAKPIFLGLLIVIFIGAFAFLMGSEIGKDDLSEKDPIQTSEEEVINDQQEITMNKAILKTTEGDITLEFYPDLAPNTVKNFQNLAKQGFYNDVIFHRVIEDFMIQGGDPEGTGRGGPGYTFDDELDPSSEIVERGYVRGTLAMANRGPNTNGSQFFIVHKDYPLPYQYTIFGRVTDGMEVVDTIASTETDQADKPLEDIVIKEISVITD